MDILHEKLDLRYCVSLTSCFTGFIGVMKGIGSLKRLVRSCAGEKGAERTDLSRTHQQRRDRQSRGADAPAHR